MPEVIKNVRDQINSFWQKLEKKQKIQIGIIAILLLASISLIVYIINRPNYVVLYSDLSMKDAGAVVDKLKNDLKIPYEITNNGSTILVPSQYKDEVRMELATQGIPQDGFSFQDAMNNSLATTDQERRQKYLYFVQNEIRDSLKTIEGVQDAVVNIVVPDQNTFVLSNNNSSATAAVMLTLKPGTVLSSSQINGIINFVSKSVEGLKPENVTLIDNNGKILTAQSDSSIDSANTQFALQEKVQNDLQNNIQSLLEQIFGPGNVIVRANVILNFDKQTQDRVEWQPVIDNKGIVRSTQELKEIANGSQNGNPSGTASNNPPGYSTTNGGNSNYNKTETTINYEINQIKTSLTSAQGKIENISIGVVVNNKNLSNSMKQQISDLVTNAAGGGKLVTVSVQGMQFNTDLLKQMQNQNKSRNGIFSYIWLFLSLILLGGAFTLYAVKKKRTKNLPLTGEEAISKIEPIEEIDVSVAEKDEKKKQIEKFIKQKPEIVAQIIRTWLNEE